MLTAAILPQAVVIPVTNSVVVGYRVAVTPDRLLGRVETVRSTISLLIAPLGPLAAGLLLERDLGPRDRRDLRRVQRRPPGVGDAQPRDPARAEPRRAPGL